MIQHIALIMDGNRRWARQNKLEVIKGHQYVADRMIEPLVEHCANLGIPYLTLWAFSTENWKRDRVEVEGLMTLFRQLFERNAKVLHEKGVRIKAIGDLSKFPDDIQEKVRFWVEETKNNSRVTVVFGLNYGGRDEILRAVNAWANDKTGEPLTEEVFSEYLDTRGIPDPDLLIRPGGEMRLSGYLPWQSVYTELYFTPVLMPDFSPAELDKALEEYARRQRRFGG
jgi:undecaprenyl diphosphate synthase